MLSPEAIDALIADAKESGIGLDGQGGLLQQMMKQVIERALQAEMADHLGYEAGDPAGRGSGNHRNGSYGKTVTTTAGPVEVDVTIPACSACSRTPGNNSSPSSTSTPTSAASSTPPTRSSR
ncbi:transposase [Streptomyces noursei]|uniref:transposase n=1 Tax=Streptomyces noursei TaxID=1971 RepID=UPI0037A67794